MSNRSDFPRVSTEYLAGRPARKIPLPPVTLHPTDLNRAVEVADARGQTFAEFVALAVHLACVQHERGALL